MTDRYACDVRFASLRSLRPSHLGLLDAGERSRHGRFRQPDDAARFTLAATLLRVAAADRLGVEPTTIVVDRTCATCGEPHGRPTLPGTGLAASITHSGDLAAVAVCDAEAVGVDLEHLRTFDWGPLVRTVCAPEERPSVDDQHDLLVYWTRKESVLKALGVGLTVPMTEVVVSPPSAPPAVLDLHGLGPTPSILLDWQPAPDYPAAVAVVADGPVTTTVVDASTAVASV